MASVGSPVCVCGLEPAMCDECSALYCQRCDRHHDPKTGDELSTTNASTIAETVADFNTSTDEAALIFGKVFEETYQEYWYRREWDVSDGNGQQKYRYNPQRAFAADFAAALRNEDIHSEERVAHGVRLFAAMMDDGRIRGKTPATEHRLYTTSAGDCTVVYAKADLRNTYARYNDDVPELVEFKTSPINDYARRQAETMSWVYDEPILLVGANTNKDSGFVHLETEKIMTTQDTVVEYFKKQ